MVFISGCFSPAVAQQESSIGLRWSEGSGVAFRQMLVEGKYLEGMVTARYGGAAVTALYQRQRPILGSEEWQWYWGGGPHLGYHRRIAQRSAESEHLNRAQINVGIDLVIAIQYGFRNFPLQFSLDVKPAISFTTSDPHEESFGLTARWRL